MSHLMTKPAKWHMRPAKTQISLGIRPVWSVVTVRMKKAWVLSCPLSASEDTDQTGWMPRLIWVFAGRTVILLVLSWGSSYYESANACVWQFYCFFTASERSAVQASAQVEADLGCPVSIHPGRHNKSPWETVRIYQEAGGHIDRLLMSHMDSKSRLIHPKVLMFCVFAAMYTSHYVKEHHIEYQRVTIHITRGDQKICGKYHHFFILCSNVIIC